MNLCIMCLREIPEGRMVCPSCELELEVDVSESKNIVVEFPPNVVEFPPSNVELSFNGGESSMDYIISYRRAKPLNRFQIWMFKMCFGIKARNI